MQTFEFPTEDETQLRLKIGDKVQVMDFFDWETIRDKVMAEVRLLGEWDNKAYVDLLIKEMKETYDLQFSRLSMVRLLVQLDDFEKNLKKKLPELQEPSDSTDSKSLKYTKKKKETSPRKTS